MRTRVALFMAAAVVGALAGGSSLAGAQQATATVTVVHGLRGLLADVYLDGELILEGFTPERATDPTQLPVGDHDIKVVEADEGFDADPVVSGTLTLAAGTNWSVVVHLSETGEPTMTPFANDVATVGPGTGRLVVRHTAAAPAIDVAVDGNPLKTGLANPDQAAQDVAAKAYDISVSQAGGGEPLVPPSNMTLADGTAQLLYLIGSTEDDSLGWLVQTVTGLQTAPTGVPSGTDGLAEPATFPVAVFALFVGLAVLTAPALVLRRRH